MTASLQRKCLAALAVALFVVLVQMLINWRTRPPAPPHEFPEPVAQGR